MKKLKKALSRGTCARPEREGFSGAPGGSLGPRKKLSEHFLARTCIRTACIIVKALRDHAGNSSRDLTYEEGQARAGSPRGPWPAKAFDQPR